MPDTPSSFTLDATGGSVSTQSLLSDVALLGDRVLVGKTASELNTLSDAARARIERLTREAAVSPATMMEAVDVQAVITAAAERQRVIELLLTEGLDATHLPDGVTEAGAESLTRGLAEALRLSGLPDDDVRATHPSLAGWINTVKESGLWSTRPERFATTPWGGRIMGSTEVAQGVMEGRLQQVVADSEAAATDVIGPTGVVSMLRTAKRSLS